MKTHYPDDRGRPLCGARSKWWPKPRPVRRSDKRVVVVIVPADVECKTCQRMAVEWHIPRDPL